jgi:hypothetical protein
MVCVCVCVCVLLVPVSFLFFLEKQCDDAARLFENRGGRTGAQGGLKGKLPCGAVWGVEGMEQIKTQYKLYPVKC